MDPASRASAWRKGYMNPQNDDDDEFDCGGEEYGLEKNEKEDDDDEEEEGDEDFKCGICGDFWYDKPHSLEAPGIYAKGIITGNYTEGQTINVTVDLTDNTGGVFIFRLCESKNIRKDPDQTCFSG